MIPLIREELVTRRRLVDDESFLETIALAQCAPGPIAGNLAVLLGYRLAGPLGAGLLLCAVALAPIAVISLIAANYAAWRSQTWAAAAFAGLRPAVVVLVAGAALRVGRSALRDRVSWVIFGAAAFLLTVLNVHPLAVVTGAAVLAGIRGLRPGRPVADQSEVTCPAPRPEAD